MKRLLIIASIILLGICFIYIGRYTYINAKYPEVLSDIESNRIKYLQAYTSVSSVKEKKEVINQVRIYLNRTIAEKVFPAWFGTPWSFNGSTQYPLQGTIACGSFVEIILKDAGFRIDDRMSAQPSEYIIKNFVKDRDIERYSNISIKTFNKEIRSLGEGIYCIGLDSHVGFLYILDGKYRFVHSHGYLFVLSEIPSLSPILRMSKYRVVGKLFDDEMITRWLHGEKFPLKFNYFNKNSTSVSTNP